MVDSGTTPSISVVMCTYCGTRYLEKQLQSIARQTLRPIELIICDDASHDDTVTLLHQFRSVAPFPVHILVNDRNIGSSRNFDQALQIASGELIALSDQDDIWLPGKLATMAKYFAANPGVGGAFSDALIINEHDDFLTRKTLWRLHRFSKNKQRSFIANGAINLLLRHDIVTGATLVVRGKLLSYLHPVPESWSHDGWIAWMLAIHSQLAPIPKPLMLYRVHPEQQLGIKDVRSSQNPRHLARTEREHHARVAAQFEDLRRYLQQSRADDTQLTSKLEAKIAFLRRRAELPQSFLPRLREIAASVQDYWRFAQGLRSLCRDIILL